MSVGFLEGRGALLTDAAFVPTDNDAVYVVPVRVSASDGASPYLAAAKLRQHGAGLCTVEGLYGHDPNQTSTHAVTDANAAIHFSEGDMMVFQAGVAADIFSTLDEEETRAALLTDPDVARVSPTLWHLMPAPKMRFGFVQND